MHITGYISDFDGQALTIYAPFENSFLLQKQEITECEIKLNDGRTISAQQRKKIYATMRDISLFTGHEPDFVKEIMKYEYIASTGADYFSLSNVDMTTANEFLSFLIEFCLEWDIPTLDNLLERSPDVARYIYACLIHKKCCICGQKTELHHVDAVGMGRNRKEIIHIGMRALPLCTQHHRELHTIGNNEFCEKYHIFGIKIDEEIAKIYKLKRSK